MVEPAEGAAVEVALAALREITPEAGIGAFVSQETDGAGVSTILFASAMPGYPGWHWTVSVAQLPGEEPTVLEAELLPGEGALLAPDWVPWSERLEDYKAAQAAIAAGELSESDDDTDIDDDDDELGLDERGDDLDEDDLDDESLDDDDLDDDDLGDDPDDGIDFESDEAPAGAALAAVPPMGDDEQHEPDAEAGQDGPEPPLAPVRHQRRKKQQ